MIRPLRATHRTVFLFLPVALAAVLVSGLALRYTWPASQSSPVPSDLATNETSAAVGGVKLKVRWLNQFKEPTVSKAQLVPTAPLTIPDLLVYWSEDPVAKALPSTARLLGSYHAGEIYSLPAEARGKGYLSLYSLAHREVLASISLGGQP
jgi:hypothetical protein